MADFTAPIRPVITISREFGAVSQGYTFEAVYRRGETEARFVWEAGCWKTPFDAIAAARKKYPASTIIVSKAVWHSYRQHYNEASVIY